ncbi:MAG TPA: hypothetical protein IAB55_06520 [Candidatus Merdivicinus faecavium]|nr:hypothetical protein [Candidatus Merdivicinus faecavium]
MNGGEKRYMGNDYIDRAAAVAISDYAADEHPYEKMGSWENSSEYNEGWNDACDYIREKLENEPAADVAPVRHGKWDDYGAGVCCTNCGISLFHQDENNNWGIEPSKFEFCPNCGARMDGEQE